MARAQNPKRARADDYSQEPPPKKIKSNDRLHGSSIPPAEFWDKLSKVWLTRNALREIDRRNSAQPAPKPAAPAVYTTDLVRFARHGGPDLHHLRGAFLYHQKATMSSGGSRSRATKSANPTTNLPKLPKCGKITPYSCNFEQHMIDHHIYGDEKAQEPAGVDEILRVMANPPRASLPLSKFDDTTFKAFRSSNLRAKDESDVLIDVIPYITGPNRDNHFAARNTVFGNLEALTDGNLAFANPDLYYGARPESLDKEVRDALSQHVIPSTTEDKPMAPNFFLEVKGPRGSPAVAGRQALYDGAMGTRGMHTLQNYGEEEPAYDGKAYTISATYYAGTLKLYAHHVTPPTAPGGRPEYHMTKIRGFEMTDTRETFIQGATAFRNVRDLAQRHRDSFIQTANARARQTDAGAPPEPETTVAVAKQDEESTDEFVDRDDYPGSQAVGTEGYAASGDVDEEPALPQHLCAEDEEPSQESTALGAEPAKSFATSSTSSFSAPSQTSSKRTRVPPSPPSNSQPRSAPRRAAGSSAQGSASSGSAVPQLVSVEEYLDLE
ncbi:hypothetical protein B0T19DRAFT_471902 [Cercophora scortea]|uniref:DUF7924 domain-containing protein n=1 Tax=Cercophora scortea TaxID=314031 RepID=A0AAE0MLE7_9PEZI|nr:hypothetical protein B0T19DRAFT_471902 [Cercophora scortea]